MDGECRIKAKERADFLSTREGYDRWSEIYDEEANPLIALEEPLVTEWLGDVVGLDVVDLGCGTGRHTLRLVSGGARVTALDFSEGMVAAARSKADWAKVCFIEHDLTKPFPLPDHAFDRVLCCLVLDHIEDLPGFFIECKRICRQSGFILISTMHPAMTLRGNQAHFTDPATGRDICPASYRNEISDFVMAATGAGLRFDHMSEHVVDEDLAARLPRATRYLGWPILLIMRLRT